MSIIERGVAIGFAAAAGVGSFIIGMMVVVVIVAAIVTLATVAGGRGDDVDDK